MPKIKVNDITINYERQGEGEPLVLIPYLAADNACYAFQVADYAKHFTCISVDPRGAGETDKPESPYSTQLFADDIAAFMHAIGVERAHVMGLSLGAATGLWLAAKYPERVKTLSLHSCWTKTDPFLKTVVEGWQTIAKGLGSVTEMIIQGIFPWCFTPELYAAKPDYIDQLAAFVRQPAPTAARRLYPAIECRHCPRCACPARPYQGTGSDHFWPPRPRDLNPLRPRDERRHRGKRTRRVRDLRACPDLRERERVQREDFELPEPARTLD